MWITETASSWLAGFTICFALVASIGAQNLFVLRQAVTGRHVSVCVAWCVLSDALLVGLGVAGMAQLLENMPVLAQALSLGGAVFLLCYGLLAWSRLLPWRGAATVKVAAAAHPPSRRAVLGALAAITLLNPHVDLDTVVLLAPNPQWVKTLPNGKLPDRNDFTHYGQDLAGRVKAWSAATAASAQLADEFEAWLRRPDSAKVQAL